MNCLRVLSTEKHRAFSIKSFHGKKRKRLAKSWPVRLAYQLEAHSGQFTILSNGLPRAASPAYGCARIESSKGFENGTRATSGHESFQEKTSTQWQKN
jgi:hypothetical protein